MLDAEMKALRAMVRALEPLDVTAQWRVVSYLHEALADNDQAPAPDPPPFDAT